MRPIDADVLVYYKYASIDCYLKSNYDSGFSQYKQGWNNAIDGIINNTPTIELCYQTTSCLDCKMYNKEKHNCPRFCEVIRELVKEEEKRSTGGWITIEAGENFLENHEWYLVVHKDYETPMKAKYHSDCPHFTFFDARGEEVSYLFENKITHYMKLPDYKEKENDL